MQTEYAADRQAASRREESPMVGHDSIAPCKLGSSVCSLDTASKSSGKKSQGPRFHPFERSPAN